MDEKGDTAFLDEAEEEREQETPKKEKVSIHDRLNRAKAEIQGQFGNQEMKKAEMCVG